MKGLTAVILLRTGNAEQCRTWPIAAPYNHQVAAPLRLSPCMLLTPFVFITAGNGDYMKGPAGDRHTMPMSYLPCSEILL